MVLILVLGVRRLVLECYGRFSENIRSIYPDRLWCLRRTLIFLLWFESMGFFGVIVERGGFDLGGYEVGIGML